MICILRYFEDKLEFKIIVILAKIIFSCALLLLAFYLCRSILCNQSQLNCGIKLPRLCNFQNTIKHSRINDVYNKLSLKE